MIQTFLKYYLGNPTVFAEWCAFIAALILLNRKTGIWRLFKMFLFFTVFVEATGWYLGFVARVHNNAWPYNISTLISDIFFIWFFAQWNQMHKVKQKLYYLLLVFAVFGLANLFFFQKFWYYNTYTETFGDILLMIISFYFLYSTLNSEEYVDFLRYEYFWLAIGLMLYSFGSALLYFFSYYLTVLYTQTRIPYYNFINYGVNVVFYSCLIVAFKCRQRNTKS